MKYKLIGSNDKNNIIEQVLINRDVECPKKYINLNGSYCDYYNSLDNIDKAVDCFEFHFERGDGIGILVDPDV